MVLKVVRGTVKLYDQRTGLGFIALMGEEDVPVDFEGSNNVVLAVGERVEFQMINRPSGVYASGVKVIQ